MEDIFDSSLNLEETHLKESFDEGYRDGLIAGGEEAKEAGLKLGFEVGEELGFYRGCVDVSNSAVRVDPIRFSARVQKGFKQMEELIEKYPIMEPENESVQEIMDGLRLKLRAVCASMGVKLDSSGYPKSVGTQNLLRRLRRLSFEWVLVLTFDSVLAMTMSNLIQGLFYLD